MLDPRRVPVAARSTLVERRQAIIGATPEGRIPFVAFTMRGGLIRVVTAYDAPLRYRRAYRRRSRRR